MSAQERTFEQYHQLMQLNAASHLIRAGRELGVLQELREGQRTLEQLSEKLSLTSGSFSSLMDALVAIGIIERYEDDFALSRAAHLLCQYDDDLGDARWDRLVDDIRGASDPEDHDDQRLFDYLAATQWVHTPSAMQAAEILNIGGEGELAGPKILDLGCGSAVWSCAMAHRDPESTVTAVDNFAALQAAKSTADSIDLSDRFQTIEGDPMEVSFPDAAFDLVLIAQRISCLSVEKSALLLERAVAAARSGGRVVVIDLFRGPARPGLSESVEALRLELGTRGGHMRSLEEIQVLLQEGGLQQVQFTFLAASKVNMGMAVGRREAVGRHDSGDS